jgi:hypothetical protein
LHLVQDQQRVNPIAGFAHGFEKIVVDGVDARLALDGFDDDGGGLFIYRIVKLGRIAVIRINESDAGDQRLERLSIFLLLGDLKRAHRAPVK